MTNQHESSARFTSPSGTVIVLILALLFTIPACYTILKHPLVIEEDYTRAETQRCSDCHVDSDLWGFHHPRQPYYPGYGRRDPWYNYYDVPWWYDSYWFYDGSDDPDTVPLPRRSLRPGDDKDPASGGYGGSIAPPPGTKSNIKTKVKTKDDSNDDTGKTSTDQKRTVRPSKKKKNKDN
jgi:hypothetical protein